MKVEDCKCRDISLGKVADLINFSRVTTSQVVNGQKKPSKKFLAALERVSIEEVRRKYVPLKTHK